MFENLSKRLSEAARSLSGKGRITETNIKDTLRQVRLALLEADVALPVVKSFINQVQERAIGEEVGKSLTPGQAFVKIIHSELVKILGSYAAPLNFKAQPPVVFMLVGLQGAGKTTTAAKLGKRLIELEKKKVMFVSVDVQRPAAILQLKKLATDVGALFSDSSSSEKPLHIVRRALKDAVQLHADVIIIDTAGRTHVDDELMQEIQAINSEAKPNETLFIVDSMAGQDAVNAAATFDQMLPLTGIILTKADGDSRGGVALSVRQVTGKPIRFLGTGEKLDALEMLYPDRLASRILGMGDILSFVEEIEQKVSKSDSKKLAQKLKKGRNFDLTDLRDQFLQMQDMGGLASMLKKLPIAGNISSAALKDAANEKKLSHQIAIINSMTPGERNSPKVINGSRKRRIALGSGQNIQDVNRLLKQYTQMERMMKKVSKGGMKKMMRSLPGGILPPGFK
ncbi:MAG: signal recognition particle protein [Gammaproteobacteria bacterium]|nr:signal recognition particle protein [Gammaproteobacteria bacterium]